MECKLEPQVCKLKLWRWNVNWDLRFANWNYGEIMVMYVNWNQIVNWNFMKSKIIWMSISYLYFCVCIFWRTFPINKYQRGSRKLENEQNREEIAPQAPRKIGYFWRKSMIFGQQRKNPPLLLTNWKQGGVR